MNSVVLKTVAVAIVTIGFGTFLFGCMLTLALMVGALKGDGISPILIVCPLLVACGFTLIVAGSRAYVRSDSDYFDE